MATPSATITVQLRVSPTLRHRLPAFACTTAADVSLPAGATVRDLAAAVGLDLGRENLLCGLNGRLAGTDSPLSDGDRVYLMHPSAGGC